MADPRSSSPSSFPRSDEVELVVISRPSGNIDAAQPPPRAILGPTSLLGSGLCVISALFFSLMQVCAHLASGTFSSAQLMLVRSLIQLVVCLAACYCAGVNPLGPHGIRLVCLFRGFLGAFSNFLLYYAIGGMPVADANAIFFTNPLFTMVYAVCLLREPSTRLEICSLFLGFAGVVFIARPSFLFGSSVTLEGGKETTVSAVFATLLGAVVGGFVPIVVRYVGSAVHHYVMVFYWGVTGTVMSVVMAIANANSFHLPPLSSALRAYQLGIVAGMFGVGTQFLYNKAMQIEKPQNCAMLRQLDVAFAFVWQHIATPSPVYTLSIVGAVMIVISTCLLLLEKIFGWKKTRQSPQAVEVPVVSGGVAPQIVGRE
ncbi:hypothetical protein FOZ62_016353 [Perkinsus olseni]|uniref:EamA domain-containing protein n=2 Tax=Perkinsus olseni TaxID=32597 RepID=A0A7J6UC79_PEROL|nr:hypothetical protein FOZ62_016353 [Perkinsus olseni]